MHEEETGVDKPVICDSTGYHINFIPLLLLSRTPKKPPLPWGVIGAFLLVFITIIALFSERAIRDKKDDTQSGTIDVVFDQPKVQTPPPLEQPPQPPQLLDPPPSTQPSEVPPVPLPKPPPATRRLPTSSHIPKKMVPPPPKPAPTPNRPVQKTSTTSSKLAKNDAPAEHSGDMPKGQQMTCSAPEMAYPTSARRAHEGGTALTEIEIDKNGNVIRSRLLQTTGYPDLDQQAMASVQKLHCTPPSDGSPMIGRIPLEFNFMKR